MNDKAIHHDPDLLNRAFGRFNQAAEVLGGYYDRLAHETASLSRQLEQKNRALSESQAENEMTRGFLTHILDHLSSGVVVLDPQGHVAMANRTASDMLDLSISSQGPALFSEKADPFPGCFGPAGDWISGRARDGGSRVMMTRTPDGRLLSVSFTSFPWPGQELAAGTIAVVDDVTDQVLRGAQRERAQSLAAMGDMAAEVSRQIRNPLGGIELMAAILGREVARDPGLTRLTDAVSSGVKKINHLLDNYLALADTPKPLITTVDLVELARESVDSLAGAAQEAEVGLELKATNPSVPVSADPVLIRQVFFNLLMNSLEAMAPGGRSTVEIVTNQEWVEAILHDNGRGIAAKDLGRVFNPFFTNKNRNLGLGLAVSHRIVDAHGGLIRIKSRPGLGTTVTVALPAPDSGMSRT